MSRIAVPTLVLCTCGGVLSGQQLPATFTRWQGDMLLTREFSAATVPQPSSSRLHQDDYRYEGLIFGGAVLGVLGAWVGSRMSCPSPLEPGATCETDRIGNAVVLGLSGAAIGGGLGYLVGRLSPKRESPLVTSGEPSPSPAGIPDSVRLRVGYQHWRGAAIGTGIGAALGGVLALVGGAGCADCTVTTADRAKVALVVTGAGGLVGFLVGLGSPRYVWVQPMEAGELGTTSHQE
jgi:hypothetical protein